MKQQQFLAEKKEKKSKKSKKEKSKKAIHEDRILIIPKAEQPATRLHIPSHHEYQNILEEQEKLRKKSIPESKLRKFGDTGKLLEKKNRCSIKNGIYVLQNTSSTGSSLTSFAEIQDAPSSGKQKHFNLSKYLNIDIISTSHESSEADKNSSDKQGNSSKSSSLSNKSVDSMEQAIIMNGLKNSENQTNSYLGPFNFRKLLKPTEMAPTESLRKRKMVILHTSPTPPPDKNLKF